MPTYTEPLPHPLDLHTELRLVFGDFRPAVPNASGIRRAFAYQRRFLAVCTRWGEYNERLHQECCELPMLEMGALADVLERDDVYVSQALFRAPNRRKANLASVALLFVDIDFVGATGFGGRHWRDVAVDNAVKLLLRTLDAKQLPRPSYIVASGRGLHVKWLTEPLPKAALPRWQACMKRLGEALSALGADPNARDASRILRPIGSLNTKAGRPVAEAWRNDDGSGGIAVYRFEELATTLLPATREQCRERREAKAAAKRPKASRNATPSENWPSRRLWTDRLREIEWLGEHRSWHLPAAGIPDGLRVSTMLIVAVALSYLVAPERILDRLREYRDRFLRHWSDEKLRQSVATVLRTAHERKRQKFSNAELRLRLKVTDAEASLMPSIGKRVDSSAEGRRASETLRRRAKGAKCRDDLLIARLNRAEQIRSLRDTGMPWMQVCEEVGVSRATANRLYDLALSLDGAELQTPAATPKVNPTDKGWCRVQVATPSITNHQTNDAWPNCNPEVGCERQSLGNRSRQPPEVHPHSRTPRPPVPPEFRDALPAVQPCLPGGGSDDDRDERPEVERDC